MPFTYSRKALHYRLVPSAMTAADRCTDRHQADNNLDVNECYSITHCQTQTAILSTPELFFDSAISGVLHDKYTQPLQHASLASNAAIIPGHALIRRPFPGPSGPQFKNACKHRARIFCPIVRLPSSEASSFHLKLHPSPKIYAAESEDKTDTATLICAPNSHPVGDEDLAAC